jgi:hypothetical protein
VEADKMLVELQSVRGKYSDPAYTAIVSRIERTWPQARNERATDYEQKGRFPNFDVQSIIDQDNLDEATEQMQGQYLTLQTSTRTISRKIQNHGGRPEFECNAWAYQEVSKRPRDRNEIFEQWAVKYIEEVGEEAANFRDLRETFNNAMRYRRGKPAS